MDKGLFSVEATCEESIALKGRLIAAGIPARHIVGGLSFWIYDSVQYCTTAKIVSDQIGADIGLGLTLKAIESESDPSERQRLRYFEVGAASFLRARKFTHFAPHLKQAIVWAKANREQSIRLRKIFALNGIPSTYHLNKGVAYLINSSCYHEFASIVRAVTDEGPRPGVPLEPSTYDSGMASRGTADLIDDARALLNSLGIETERTSCARRK